MMNDKLDIGLLVKINPFIFHSSFGNSSFIIYHSSLKKKLSQKPKKLS